MIKADKIESRNITYRVNYKSRKNPPLSGLYPIYQWQMPVLE